MRRLSLGLVAALVASPALAQPTQVSSLPFNGTVTTALTFQQVLPTRNTRAGAILVNTSTDTEQVYIGPAATNAVMAVQSFPLTAGGSMNLELADGAVIQSPVWITGPTTGDAYRGAEQQ